MSSRVRKDKAQSVAKTRVNAPVATPATVLAEPAYLPGAAFDEMYAAPGR